MNNSLETIIEENINSADQSHFGVVRNSSALSKNDSAKVQTPINEYYRTNDLKVLGQQ